MTRRAARRAGIGLVAGVAALAAPAAASADERIVAGAGNRYLTTAPSIDQGELLTFQNQDVARHDVTATQDGPDGKPLFASELIGQGQEVEVVGARYLTSGSYGFFCTIHPFMTGTLTVTSAGTPLPRPGGGDGGANTPPPADTTAPSVSVGVGRKLRRGRLPVVITTDEAARVTVTATARLGRRTVSLGRLTQSVGAARRTTFSIRLSSRARRALRGQRRVRVRASAVATDAAGNRGRGASTGSVTL
ncbi:MAG TPA: plastocyanin/azurin family copper-binding protein [Thermoleophilaceae bacterium]|nr:plastocyanin/azurin family copper-binding protein [Thermoleophilaceae bacterium]